ncbi:MAG: hypothetical protein V2A79_20110 [Planctomycetota bacterium]
MAKKGPKVKELAVELGVTARAIIERCRAAGVPVQNSITRLNPELEQILRAWFTAANDGTPRAMDGAEKGEWKMEN